MGYVDSQNLWRGSANLCRRSKILREPDGSIANGFAQNFL